MTSHPYWYSWGTKPVLGAPLVGMLKLWNGMSIPYLPGRAKILWPIMAKGEKGGGGGVCKFSHPFYGTSGRREEHHVIDAPRKDLKL